MTRPQPTDEWKFLPADNELDDAEAPGAAEVAAEVAALHVEARRPEWAYSDLTSAPAPDGPPVTYFEDEEPETARPRPSWAAEDGPEPDLEELLESQHYAFDADADTQADAQADADVGG